MGSGFKAILGAVVLLASIGMGGVAHAQNGGVPNIGPSGGTGDPNAPDMTPPGVGGPSALTDHDGDGIPTIDELDKDGNSFDSDGDGIDNYLDIDDDNDGIYTKFETGDSDGDTILDYLDDDDDGDGLATFFESPDENGDGNPDDAIATDGGLPDYLDPDDDGDTIPTREERLGLTDIDADGVPNYLDDDDDGDSIRTIIERADAATFGDNVDLDGVPSWHDLDSDDDGILDSDELRFDEDSDGVPNYLDNVDDSMGSEPTDPVDPGAMPNPIDPCVGLPGVAGCEDPVTVPGGSASGPTTEVDVPWYFGPDGLPELPVDPDAPTPGLSGGSGVRGGCAATGHAGGNGLALIALGLGLAIRRRR